MQALRLQPWASPSKIFGWRKIVFMLNNCWRWPLLEISQDFGKNQRCKTNAGGTGLGEKLVSFLKIQ